jgi:nicotinate-nucleotide adenylyltransferase
VPGLRAWSVELERPGPSYSVDTVRALRRALGADARIVFLIGRDAFAELHSWKDFAALLGLCDFAVMTRPPRTAPLSPEEIPVATQRSLCYDPAIAGFRHESGHRVISLAITSLDVSASDIRARVAGGRSIRFLVPRAVEEYIDRHGLYRTPEAPT